MTTDPLIEQIEELVSGAIIGPAGDLLGVDLHEVLTERLHARSARLAAELTSSDKRTAAEAAISIAPLLPDMIPAEWWATPLGRAVAASYDPPQTVTGAEAARILGVSRARISTLGAERKLSPQPGGGYLLTEVLDRLVSADGD